MEQLNAHEARVLGVLIEKAFTTPDQYPLSLNGLTNGSNQKSNRHPIVDFIEAEVTVALQGLRMKHLAGSVFPQGSRVEKWSHSTGAHLKLDDHGTAVLAELLLRGPQSVAELRTRASRMRDFASPEALMQIVTELIDKGYVKRRPAGQGSRVEKFEQLLAPTLYPEGTQEGAPAQSAPAAPLARTSTSTSTQVDELEQRVARLERQLGALAEQLGETLHE